MTRLFHQLDCYGYWNWFCYNLRVSVLIRNT
jgi:hypothetical protein